MNNYFNTVLRQNGNNIGVDRGRRLSTSRCSKMTRRTLQSTLDIINTMSGIEDVNMYDAELTILYYSSFKCDSESHSNPDCITLP
ncbi:MAG: hypothetical protein MZV63_25370 [Marinilabiliales bacterium]|nr:hypothetical protein [Marinilabiliales bacterium]